MHRKMKITFFIEVRDIKWYTRSEKELFTELLLLCIDVNKFMAISPLVVSLMHLLLLFIRYCGCCCCWNLQIYNFYRQFNKTVAKCRQYFVRFSCLNTDSVRDKFEAAAIHFFFLFRI